MENEAAKGPSLDLSVNPLTVISIFVGAIIAYFLYQFVNAGKLGVAKISKALDKTAEKSGFAKSEGQNDPYVLYNNARVDYSIAQGYDAGSDYYKNPPGFPDMETWLQQNPDAKPSSTFSAFNTFWGSV